MLKCNASIPTSDPKGQQQWFELGYVVLNYVLYYIFSYMSLLTLVLRCFSTYNLYTSFKSNNLRSNNLPFGCIQVHENHYLGKWSQVGIYSFEMDTLNSKSFETTFIIDKNKCQDMCVPKCMYFGKSVLVCSSVLFKSGTQQHYTNDNKGILEPFWVLSCCDEFDLLCILSKALSIL